MARFEFGYDSDWYSVQGASILQKEAFSEMKKEYTRMRDVAQKRIKRLGESAFKESKAYTSHAAGFKKISEIDPRDFAKAFSELAKFVGAKGSSVSGQREIRQKTMAAWKAQGINLNPANYQNAIKILEEMRKRKITYGSDKVVTLADTMLELNKEQTNQILNNLDSILPHVDELQQVDNIAGQDINELISEFGW